MKQEETTIDALEYNTRSQLIDPILDALGWTFPYRRHCEVVCVDGCRADYALYNNGKYQYVIEAKKAKEKILDDHCEQLKNYIVNTCKFVGALGVLTNGYEWRIYSYENDVEKLLFKTDDITIDDINGLVKSLSCDKNNLSAIVDKCKAIIEDFKTMNRLADECQLKKDGKGYFHFPAYLPDIKGDKTVHIKLSLNNTLYKGSSYRNWIYVNNENYNGLIEGKFIRIYKTEESNVYRMEYVEPKPLDFGKYKNLLFLNLTQFAANEYNVRTQIIDPILDNLGWVFPCHRTNEQCCKRRNKTKRADYLLTKDNLNIVVEAKSIDKNLQEQKGQLMEYAKNDLKGAIGILTNGFEWQVFYRNWDNPIARTDITRNGFTQLMDIFRFDKFNSESIEHLKSLHINDDCETFYKNGDLIRITENGKEICSGNSCTQVLIKCIGSLTNEEREELRICGTFDRIILTKDGKLFQRQIGSQEYETDYEDYYITRDYAIVFKYLIIKQIANRIRPKWKVEYCNKK